ncbi:MAG TPA: GNAT family N-acetyltransferase [Acetivibrio thermocellus]|nr:GNAT family N-acetyltransferase [Acetivibrio thermocellus]HOP92829.1 GNAT family N-acetyltransferase [Acetivibrio thermocellus]
MDTLKIITDRLIITEFNVSMAEIVHENIGYVQAVPIGDEWEVGYHIASKYTGNGYATEAVKAFVPLIMKRLNIKRIWGICRASCRVLEKCSFSLKEKCFGDYKGQNQEIYKYVYEM